MSGAPRPLVKVCGFRDPADVELAVDLGVWAVGFIFARSPRSVEPARAADLVKVIRGRKAEPMPKAIGVFADEDPGRLAQTVEEVGLDGVQLHGNETEKHVRLAREVVGDGIVIRALGVPPSGPEDLEGEAAPFLGAVDFILLDTVVGGRSGGTGRTFQWDAARRLASRAPVLIAGGLGPGNAVQALEASGAAGVDVCSGIEREPGVKDPRALRALVRELRGLPVRRPGRDEEQSEEGIHGAA